MRDKIEQWLTDKLPFTEKGNYILTLKDGPKMIEQCFSDLSIDQDETLEYEDWQEAKDLLVEADFTVLPPK